MLDYQKWIDIAECAAREQLAQPGPGSRSVQRRPSLGLVLLDTIPPALEEIPEGCTILCLHRGPVPAEATLARRVPASFQPADAVGLALEALDAEMLCFLGAGERLAPGALHLVATVLQHRPLFDVVFTDEDWLGEAGRRMRPFFKPGWDPELQRGRDLLGPFTFLRASLVRAATVATGPAWRYDLASQVAAAAGPGGVCHIPAVLCHRTATEPGFAVAAREAAAAQLQREGVAALVEPVGTVEGHRALYVIPRPEPLVSVIVPTRDRVDLLRACAEGVLRQTNYPSLELLIVDNDTVAEDALALLDELAADPRVRVLRRPGPFNWSALNNGAACTATGSVLLLLNNDTAVLRPDWLTVLVAHVVQPGVGAVGAKLLYPDGRVQHAGLTTDSRGVPRHLFRYLPGDAADPYGMTTLARTVWAVTGACLAVTRATFFKVGGLNESLPIAYNDVDFCLRLAAHGYRTVWTPWSLVEHHELATRPPDHSPERREKTQEELDHLRRDWGGLVLHDPWLNPNLELAGEKLGLRRTVEPAMFA